MVAHVVELVCACEIRFARVVILLAFACSHRLAIVCLLFVSATLS